MSEEHLISGTFVHRNINFRTLELSFHASDLDIDNGNGGG